MKLVNFTKNNEVRPGIKTEQGIIDIREAGEENGQGLPSTMKELIEQDKLNDLEELSQKENINVLSEDDIVYAPVVEKPEKILCVGLNYLEHVEEAESEDVPDNPILFSKFNNALAAHNETIQLPAAGKQFDYEAELVIVIGKEAKDVSKGEALSYVFGYSVGNDLSVRDLQFKTGQWLLGKTTDQFAPVGPYLVTADEIDPTNLDISMERNGETVQSSNTKHMIFDCATIISYASKYMTLKPGDLIFTGTPEGVIMGYPEDERQWLSLGETLEARIQNVGVLKNDFA